MDRQVGVWLNPSCETTITGRLHACSEPDRGTTSAQRRRLISRPMVQEVFNARRFQLGVEVELGAGKVPGELGDRLMPRRLPAIV